jgi:hypothetical protein
LDYINSLISGIVVFKIGREYIYVKPASAEDRTFADFFSQEQYDDALIDGLWTQDDAEKYLIEMGYWSKEEEEKIEELEKNMENMKLDYFNNFYNSSTKDYIKSNLKKQTANHQELMNKKYLFYDKTCEYLKKYSHTSYLLQKTSFCKDKKLACKYFSSQTLFSKYSSVKNDISIHLREIAKSEEWRSKWISIGKRIFSNRSSSFTELQISIISWSAYYDSIYKSYDKPSDEIIEDDIALDGWSISQRRKRKEEEKKKNAEKMLPENMKNAGEIFIPARNAKEASDIMSLNNQQGLHKIKSLRRDLDREGAVEESQLTSTRRELQMQAVQMSKNNRRR